MFIRLLRFLLKMFARPVPPAQYLQHFNAGSSTWPVSHDGRVQIVFNGENNPDGPAVGYAIDEHTILIPGVKNPIDASTVVTRSNNDPHPVYHYRDEDGEMRPLRRDRDGLSVMAIDELAAEFLRAKSDADAAPDPLERAIIAALRDTYSRELMRRAMSSGPTIVHVGGVRYEIVPFPLEHRAVLVRSE